MGINIYKSSLRINEAFKIGVFVSILRGGAASGILILFYLVSSANGAKDLGVFSFSWAFASVSALIIKAGIDTAVLKKCSVLERLEANEYFSSGLRLYLRNTLFFWLIFFPSAFFLETLSLYFKYIFLVLSLAPLLAGVPIYSCYCRAKGHIFASATVDIGFIAWSLSLALCVFPIEMSVVHKLIVAGGGVLSVMILLTIAIVTRLQSGLKHKRLDISLRRRILGSELLNSIQGWAMIVISPFLLQEEQIAVFSVFQRFAQMPNMFLQALSMLSAPRYARFFSENRASLIWNTWRNNVLLGLGVVLPIAFLGVIFSGLVGDWYGFRGEDNTYVAAWLFGAQISSALGGGCLMIGNMVGKENMVVKILFFASVIQMASFLILAQLFGVIGLSFSYFVFSCVVSFLGNYLVVFRLFKV